MGHTQTYTPPFLAKIYAGRQRRTEAESVQGDGARQAPSGGDPGAYAAPASQGEASPPHVRRDGIPQHHTHSVDRCPDAPEHLAAQLKSAATGQERPKDAETTLSARGNAAAAKSSEAIATSEHFPDTNEMAKQSQSTPIAALTSAVAAMTGPDNAESATTSNNDTAISSRASNASSTKSAGTATSTTTSTATTASSSTSEPALDFATDSSLDGFSSSESVASSSSATTGRGRGIRAPGGALHTGTEQSQPAMSKTSAPSPAFRSTFQIYGPASPLTGGTDTRLATSSSYYYSPTMPFYTQPHPVHHQSSQQQRAHQRHHQPRHGSVWSYDSSSTGREGAEASDGRHSASASSSATTSPVTFDSLAHRTPSRNGRQQPQLLPLTLPPPSLDLPTAGYAQPGPFAPSLVESRSYDTVRSGGRSRGASRSSGSGALRDVHSEPSIAAQTASSTSQALTATLPYAALSPSAASVSAASASTPGTSPGGFSAFSYASASTSSPSDASASGAVSPPFPTPTLRSASGQVLQGHDGARRGEATSEPELDLEPQQGPQQRRRGPSAVPHAGSLLDSPAPFAAFPHLPLRAAPAFTRQSSTSTSYSRSPSPGDGSFEPVTVPLLCPPDNFAMVAPGVYRSSFPSQAHYPFLRSLRLRTVLTLVQDEYSQENASFFEKDGIQFFQIGIPGNKEPFVHIPDGKIRDALRIVLDKRNHPIMIHCNKGKHRTGCLVGCLRKMQCWSSTAIFEEYRKFSFPKSRAMDQLFIELYQPDWACLAADELPEWCKEEDGGLAGRSEEYLISHSAAASPAFGYSQSRRMGAGKGKGKERECGSESPSVCGCSRDEQLPCGALCSTPPTGAKATATPSRCTSPLCEGADCSTPKGKPKVRLKESWVNVKIGSTIPDDEDPSETEEDDL